MTALHRRTARHARTRRAVQMIEFALVFPVLLLFLIFTIDMGMAVLRYAGLQDAAYSSARASAQAGGAEVGTPHIAGEALKNAVGNIPGYQTLKVVELQSDTPSGATAGVGQVGYSILTGDRCTVTGPDSYVTVDVSTTPKLITPGMGAILGFISHPSSSGNWSMHARAVSRCEVVLPENTVGVG